MCRLVLLATIAYHVIVLTVANLTENEIAIFRQNNFTVEETDHSWTLKHHGLPDHGFHGGFGNNPNTPSVQNHMHEIPKIPTPTADGSEGCVYLGAMAMAISGAPFYNPYTGGGKNAVEGNCKETFDHCDGHPSPNGAYHYHQLPSCLYFTKDDQRDVFLGVAFDGYAIYGPMDETGKNVTSRELDKCHGHIYKGRYIYRVTFDFPYVMSCYHGTTIGDRRPVGGQQGSTRPTGGQRPSGGQGRPSPTDDNQQRPPGDSDEGSSDCNIAMAQNWQMETCYAFCENPGTGTFDNCGHGLVDDDNPTDSGLRIGVTLHLTVVSTVVTCLVKYIVHN